MPHISVAESCQKIQTKGRELKAFTLTRCEEALGEAEILSHETPRSVLHNVPYSLKDYWDVAGQITTGGSYRYKDRSPQTSSAVFEVFRDAGAVLMGKTNLSDLALALESANYIAGETQNPHDPKRTSGGSSGGAAAAVASGCVVFDWGSDFGGSIRMPAAFCGVFGLRLSASLWPLDGAFPQVPDSLLNMNGQGPFATEISTMRQVMNVAAPRLRRGEAPSFTLNGVAIISPMTGLRGQWPNFAQDATKAVQRVGLSIQEHSLLTPLQATRMAQNYLCSHFEDLIEVDPLGFWEGLGAVLSAMTIGGWLQIDKRLHPRTAEVLALLGLGRVFLAPKREVAIDQANRWRDSVRALWDRGVIVAAPICVYPAPLHGRSNWNPLYTAYTFPWNVADATCMAVPMGRFENGMPRAMQLCGPPGSEWALMDLAEKLSE
jgi:Asp-tRNA(Asn)/Glu-tRNA(Gln) amidotransferase A subunit family amidase